MTFEGFFYTIGGLAVVFGGITAIIGGLCCLLCLVLEGQAPSSCAEVFTSGLIACIVGGVIISIVREEEKNRQKLNQEQVKHKAFVEIFELFKNKEFEKIVKLKKFTYIHSQVTAMYNLALLIAKNTAITNPHILEETISPLIQAPEYKKMQPVIAQELGNICLKNSQFLSAIKYYKAIPPQKDNSEIDFRIGACFLLAGKYTQAEEHLTKALALNFHPAVAYNLLLTKIKRKAPRPEILQVFKEMQNHSECKTFLKKNKILRFLSAISLKDVEGSL